MRHRPVGSHPIAYRLSLLAFDFCLLTFAFIPHPSSFILYFKVLLQNSLRLGDFGIIMRDRKNAVHLVPLAHTRTAPHAVRCKCWFIGSH